MPFFPACKRWLAALGTEALSPFVLAAILFIAVPLQEATDWWWQAAVPLVFVVGVPWTLSLWMAHTGRTTDKFIVIRAQRHRFYAMSLASILVGTALLLALPAAWQVKALIVMTFATVAILAALTLLIKASAHACLAAIFSITLSYLYGPPAMALALPIVLLVSWSRWWLRKHTVTELLAGIALGTASGFIYASWALKI